MKRLELRLSGSINDEWPGFLEGLPLARKINSEFFWKPEKSKLAILKIGVNRQKPSLSK